jgi:hypothetical protein
MKYLALVIAAIFLVGFASPFVSSTTSAETVPIPTLTITILGETNGTRQQFSRDLLLVPEVPIHLIITFHNNDTMGHTFTINDVNGTKKLDTGIVSPGINVTVNFTVLSLTRIAYNGTQFTPEVAQAGGIQYFCSLHPAMIGRIALAGVTSATTPEKGILLRAYWIGIIGIAATLLWVIISYFVIKSSSRHFTDHSEHVRKGLP